MLGNGNGDCDADDDDGNDDGDRRDIYVSSSFTMIKIYECHMDPSSH